MKATTPTFDAMHFIYKSAKSSNGYVVSSKQLKGQQPVWSCPSNDLAQQWIAHQVHMHNRQAAIDNGATMAQAKEQYPQPIVTNDKDNTMMFIKECLDTCSLEELAWMQLQIAQRIQELVATNSQNEVTAEQAAMPTTNTAIATTSDPSNAPVQLQPVATDVESTTAKKRKVRSKKTANVEAVKEQIDKALCAMTRDEARAFIKLHKLPIKGNMSCELLNDAINAYNAGGIDCVPERYLTKAAAVKQAQARIKAESKGFAQQQEAAPAKKTARRVSKSSVGNR